MMLAEPTLTESEVSAIQTLFGHSAFLPQVFGTAEFDAYSDRRSLPRLQR